MQKVNKQRVNVISEINQTVEKLSVILIHWLKLDILKLFRGINFLQYLDLYYL